MTDQKRQGRIAESVGFAREMIAFLIERRAVWLAPIIFVMILIGSTFLILEGTVVAPLIYAIF